LGEPPRRQPSQSRLTHPVIEQNVAPPQREVLVARPVPRKQTPVAMPAPPPALPSGRPQSHDDLERVTEVERLERERAQLAAELQDARQENSLLRETAPTVIFPPPSIPPSDPRPPKIPVESVAPVSTKKYVLSQRLMHLATALGIFGSIAWNAFNSYRTRNSPEKVDAVEVRVNQGERTRASEIAAVALERQRTLQALRASECMFRQIRGAIQRQGLDLTSLPAGGVEVVKIAPEDPNRPGVPAFITKEQCTPFPRLPPEP